MRLFEILAFVTLLISLIALLNTRKKLRWFVYLPGFTLIVVLCQVVFEGIRWQMIPAYFLIFVVFLISLKQILGAKKEQQERLSMFKRILKFSVTIIIILLFIISIILPLEVPMFRIPHPTGKFKVGSSILFFSDTTRIDAFSPENNRFRELSVRAWYPASPGNRGKRMPFMQTDEARYRAIYLKGAAFMLSHFKLIKTNSYLNAEPIKDPFPVILYSPSGCIVENTTLFQELASHGYIVFSVCHPYWNTFYYDEQAQVKPLDTDNTHYKSLWVEKNSSEVIKTKEEITNAKDLQSKQKAQQMLNKYIA